MLFWKSKKKDKEVEPEPGKKVGPEPKKERVRFPGRGVPLEVKLLAMDGTMRTVGHATLALLLLSTAASCDSSEKKSTADDGAQDPEFCVPDEWVSSEEPPCTVEPEPDVEEGEQDNCHRDCFGGLKCSGGVMQAAISVPLPCSEDSCYKGGPKWPCLSGVCGEFELCSDDETYLIGLVPADSVWKEGKRILDQGLFERFDGIVSYTTSVTLVDEDDHDVLRADLSPFPSEDGNKIAGTTHLQAAPLGVENIHVLEISGTPVVADGGTRIFSPLLQFMDGHDNDGHEQGIGGALLIQHSDGAQTTVVWRATNDWEKVLFAVYTE